MAREYVCDHPGCQRIISYDWNDRALPFKGAFIKKNEHGELRNEQLRNEWERGNVDATFHCLRCLETDEKAYGTFTSTYSIIARYEMLDLSRLGRGQLYWLPYNWRYA